MSLQALQTWLKANAAKAREVMWANKSFVFFKEHAQKEASGPQGVHDITLTPGRSLAVDPSYHALGLPIFVAAPEIKHIPVTIGGKPESPPASSLRKSAAVARETAQSGFHRLMVAQDVGSAIKGVERGDIYVGTGDLAGKIAGITKHPGNFFVLVPKPQTKGRQPSVAAAPVAVAPAAASSAVPAPPPTASAKPAAAKPAATVAAPPPAKDGPANQPAKDLPKAAPARDAPAALTTQKARSNEAVAVKPVRPPDTTPAAPGDMGADKSEARKPASKDDKADDAAAAIADQMRTSLQ